MTMTDARGRIAEHTTLGLTIAALGCTPQAPGSDDEAGSSDETSDETGETEETGETGTLPNDIPFELVFGGLNATGKFVALRFSEAVGPVEGIDPADFRISYAQLTKYCDYYGCDDQTRYWDPNFYAHDYIPYQPDPNVADRFEVDLVVAGMQDTDVFLRFAEPLNPALCNYTGGNIDYIGLFVHYSPGGIPLKSADGESLAPIGLQWVEEPGPAWSVAGTFPNLDPKIAIDCKL